MQAASPKPKSPRFAGGAVARARHQVRVAGAQRSDARRGVPGHDAGDKVLSGRISRGVAERINAVIWYSDLAAVAPEPERSALVSVARYALRGVGRAQEFVTPDPAHG